MSDFEEFSWDNANNSEPNNTPTLNVNPQFNVGGNGGNGLPNQTQHVQKMAMKNRPNYNDTSSQARQAQGIPVNNTVVSDVNAERVKQQQYQQQIQQHNQNMGYAQQGQPNPQMQQQMQQQMYAQQMQQQQMYAQQMQNNQQVQQRQNQQSQGNQQNTPKKKSKLPLIIGGVAIVGLVGFVALRGKGGNTQQAQEIIYETSGRYAYETLLDSIHNLDATNIDAVVGTTDGDSYIAQEWAYINGVALRQEFLTRVSGIVDFKYPDTVQKDTNGNPMIDADGEQVVIESYMNNGENITVTIPDYDAIASEMDTDKEYIENLFKGAGYAETDYTWNDEMANLMFQWILDKSAFPTTTVELALPIGNNGQAYIKDDAMLDDVMYGSDAFRNMSAKFSQISLGYTGYTDETYMEKEEQHNDEYDEWFKLFMKYYKEDGGKYDKKTGKFKGGKFKKGVSKWEPWFLRDNDNKFIFDEDGEKVVNYYSVKKKDGTDWIQPDETIMVEVEKTRQIEDPWQEERGVMYNVLGTHYIATAYNGLGDTTFRVGDGSKENPAGIGTSIITKAPCKDGKFHDVKVTLIGYWTEQNAIDYVENFDTRNRGFSTTSAVSLITFEMRVQNLENKPITVVADMALSDGNSNVSSRTGTIYGFASEKEIQPGEFAIINDWATSTELLQKYVVWGKSFGRTYSMVYFDCLAGTGMIPSYSAYRAFTGESSLNSQFTAETMEQYQAMPSKSTPKQEETTADGATTPESDTK